jgi:hypothetical protein
MIPSGKIQPGYYINAILPIAPWQLWLSCGWMKGSRSFSCAAYAMWEKRKETHGNCKS